MDTINNNINMKYCTYCKKYQLQTNTIDKKEYCYTCNNEVKKSPKIEEFKEQLCDGASCVHDIGQRHYIILEDDLKEIIR